MPNQIEGVSGTIVCLVSGSTSNESVIADARLIAAAPELLEVLRDALDSLDYVERTLPGLSGYGVRQERIQKARAAIAKATGEQQ